MLTQYTKQWSHCADPTRSINSENNFVMITRIQARSVITPSILASSSIHLSIHPYTKDSGIYFLKWNLVAVSNPYICIMYIHILPFLSQNNMELLQHSNSFTKPLYPHTHMHIYNRMCPRIEPKNACTAHRFFVSPLTQFSPN